MYGAAGREDIRPEARIQQNDGCFDYSLSFVGEKGEGEVL
jgi:hypothetical protein